MGTCEVCGNEYEKAFEVVAAGGEARLRQLRVCDSQDGPGLRALPVPDRRSRGRGRWPLLLLRQLCPDGWGALRPGLASTLRFRINSGPWQTGMSDRAAFHRRRRSRPAGSGTARPRFCQFCWLPASLHDGTVW